MGSSELQEKVTRGRCAAYLLLSRLFEREADEDLLEELHEALMSSSGLGEGLGLIYRYLDGIRDRGKTVLELATDYADLFLGVRGLPHPSESSYRSGRGLIMKVYAEEVLREYWKAGVDKLRVFHEPPDHAAIELQFMAYLCDKTLDAMRRDDDEEIEGFLEEQRKFLEKHLTYWLPKLSENIIENASTDFYRGVALLARELVEEDFRILGGGRPRRAEHMEEMRRMGDILDEFYGRSPKLTVLRRMGEEEAEKLREESERIRICYLPTNLLGLGMAELPQEVHIRAGRIIRIRPIYFDEGLVYGIAAKGREFTRPARSLPAPYEIAYKERVYSPARVRYPLRRVDWSPENRNPQNRGKSKFMRISWDEALDIIAREVKRIVDKYGTTAVAVMADGLGHSTWRSLHSYAHALCEVLGGCIHVQRNPDSFEGYYWGAKHAWGMDSYRGHQYQDDIWEDVLENTEMMICTGCDPETTSWGFWSQSGSITMDWIKRAGIKLVFISPDLNHTAAVHADKWIPIRPNTDAALYLSIAYIWIKEGTYDEEYIETHTVGFDEFKKYVMGDEDGIPKTPEWAEGITGIPVETIRALAREWARKRTSIAYHYGGPKIRGPYATEPARLEVLLSAMQGLGRPGVHHVRIPAESSRARPKPASSEPVPSVPASPDLHPSNLPRNPYVSYVFEPHEPSIPKTLLPEAILSPSIEWYGSAAINASREDQFVKHRFPREGEPGIHMLIDENGSWLTSWNGTYRMMEALRSSKLEFVLVIEPWFENDCKFADLVLPASTPFEQEDFAVRATGIPPVSIIWTDMCIEPIGEAKGDYDIIRAIEDKLGLKTLPRFEEFVKSRYEESPMAKRIDWKELKEKKMVLLPAPTSEEWEEIKRMGRVKPGLRWFYEDPEGHPLETPTGKIEFRSVGLAERFPDDGERPPVPHYIPYGETHQESLSHPRSERYPLLMVSNHPRWRVHAQGDDNPWLVELPASKISGPDGYPYEPLWMNPIDAERRGIIDGDIVKVYNDRGTVLAGAYLTNRVPKGVVRMDKGSRVDIVSIEDKIDRGGAINLISPFKTISRRCPGMTVSGYLVEVEKVDLMELTEKYPEVFGRRRSW